METKFPFGNIDRYVHWDFAISSYCNSKCPSCKRYENFWTTDSTPVLHPNLRQVHMKFDDFKELISKNMDLFLNKICWFEGEFGDPFVNPEIDKFIDFGTEIFEQLTIITNGGVKRPEFYDKLAEKYDNLEIRFSIDGLTHETNSKYRVGVDTNKAFQNMLAFSKKSKKCSWQYLIFDHNYHEIEDVLKFSDKYKISTSIKINSRPRFKIDEQMLNQVKEVYEKYKHNNSNFYVAN